MPNGRDRFQFDEAALAQIENIRRIGLRRLRNRNEIDDFVQETLLRAFSKRSQLRDETKFEAWIAAIARNLAREWNRAYYRRKRVEADNAEEAVDSRNPMDALEKAEERELLKKAVARLNESDREILRARYVDDASYAELQERYGLSYSAVGLRLHRAKKRLRKIYLSIAAALSLFFGSFKHTAWGGAILMKKTAAIAVGIGVLIGALGVGFFWMQGGGAFWTQTEGGAPIEQIAPDAINTEQTAPDTANGMDAAKKNEAQNAAKAEAQNIAKAEASSMSKGAEPLYEFMDIPDLILDVDRTGDIWHFELSRRELAALLDRTQKGGGDIEDVYALIDGFELPTDWKRYLYVYAKDQLGLPLAADEKNYLSNGGVHLVRQHIERWNADDAEVGKELGFIRAARQWGMQHAPAEYEQLHSRYINLVWQEGWLPMEIGNFASVEERVNALHNCYLQALSEMPEDARMWTEYFSAIKEPTPASQVPNQADTLSTTKKSTEPDAPPTKLTAAGSGDITPASSVPVEMDSKIRTAMERYGVQAGLREIAETHPELTEHILRWAEERYRRQLTKPTQTTKKSGEGGRAN